MNAQSDPSRRALDRVTVARRRAEQLAAFLSQAERAVDAGDYETAIAACEEVLFLDPHNEVATRLIEEIRVWDPAAGGRVFRPARLAEDGNPLPGDWPEESVELDMFPSETELVFPRAPELVFRTEREIADHPHASADTREGVVRERATTADEQDGSTAAHAHAPALPPPNAPAPVEDVVTPVASEPLDDLLMRPPERPAPPPVSPPRPPEWAPITRPAWTAAPSSVVAPSRIARVTQSMGAVIPWPGWMSRPAVGTALLLALAVGLVSLWAVLGPPPTAVTGSVPAPPTAVAEPLSVPPTTESAPAGASLPETGRTENEGTLTRQEPAIPTPSLDSLSADTSRRGTAAGGDFGSRTDPAAAATNGGRQLAPLSQSSGSIQPERAPFARPPQPEVPAAPPVALAPPAASAAVFDGPTAAPTTVVNPPVLPPAEVPVAAAPRPAPVVPAAPNAPSPGVTSGVPVSEIRDARENAPARAPAPPSVAVAEPVASVTEVPARPTSGDEERAVRAAVQAYTSAYTGLNADAVKAVFPSVNDAALRRAFRSLRSQRVELRGMSVAIAGDGASVSGTWVSSAVGQVGDSTPQRDERPVIFTLAKRNGSWVIVNRR